MTTTESTGRRPSLSFGLLLIAVVGVAAFAVVMLLVNIFEKKQEAKNPFFRVVEITNKTDDPAVWGKNFPLQYDDYLQTVDMEMTRHGGSEAVPHEPNAKDPRSFVARSVLEQVPQLKRLWAGYAFSKDYREKRGHAYMLTDQLYTERQQVGQPGTCIHCHASMVVAYDELGQGDPVKGFEALNHMKYDEAKTHVNHSVACIDCHDPQSMAIRVTRPAFIEGIAALKKSQGVEDFQVNRDATHQEMRSYVCGQCHVEYYFRGSDKRLTYPWAKGLNVDDIYAYYEEEGFTDWKHGETGAPMLKAQHPEFEMWNQGIHSRAGVACADCHMPYKRVGAVKISDHHVRSPLLNINNACQTCHKATDEELKGRAEMIQGRTLHGVDVGLKAIVELIDDIKAAKEKGATDEQLKDAFAHQRKASFYIDFVQSENSSGFHAGQESLRILTDALDAVRKGQLAVRDIKPAEEKQTPPAPDADTAKETN